ncbi:hypothetical protein [Saccharothrix texasensis]|nr:hypothetical protein [Saccharothrix texasensis]
MILSTARVQEGDVEDGFARGADAYLTKPFSPREPAGRVRAVVARSRR